MLVLKNCSSNCPLSSSSYACLIQTHGIR